MQIFQVYRPGIQPSMPSFQPGQLTVQFKDEPSEAELKKFNKKYGTTLENKLELKAVGMTLYTFSFETGKDPNGETEALRERIAKDARVESCDLVHIFYPANGETVACGAGDGVSLSSAALQLLR